MPELVDNQEVRLEQFPSGLSFPLSSPTSALCSDQKRKLQLKGRKCEEGKIWIFPGALPQGLLLLATWSFWFPKAQTAIWLTFLAALSCPVAGDGGTAVCHQCVQELRNTYLGE